MDKHSNTLQQHGSVLTVEQTLRDVGRVNRCSHWIWLVCSWLLALLLLGSFIHAVVTNQNFEWHVVARWFSDGSVMRGLGVTLSLASSSMLLGVALGLLLAVARMANNALLRILSGLYIWFFRGTPLLVQLIFWYNLSALFPRLGIGIPFTDIGMDWPTNDLITPLTAAIAGLALNEAAYMAEIIRGGLLSVDRGQAETARAFGMSRVYALRRIIIPQAMRAIVPPTGNEFISMIKATSLVSVIAMGDMLYSVQTIYNRTFEIIPMLMVAVIWYLLVTSLLNIGQIAIEHYYSRGVQRADKR